MKRYDEQGTLGGVVALQGTGLHTGRPVRAVLRPAPPGTGIRFHRLDVDPRLEVPARLESVVDSRLATTLGRGPSRVGTVEHLLAALAAWGVDNARVELDGPELPVLDGSAAPWMEAIGRVGRLPQPAPRSYLEVLEPVRVEQGPRWAALLPSTRLELSVRVDFPHPLLRGRRLDFALEHGPEGTRAFARELAWARTFGFASEVEALRRQGLALGGSLDNALVFDERGVLNPGGQRGPDEAVRHKLLDALGDLALLGLPLRARFEAERPGHVLHVELLRALLERPGAWREVPAEAGEQVAVAAEA